MMLFRNIIIVLLVFAFISCSTGMNYHSANQRKHKVHGGAGNTGLNVRKSCSKTTD